MAQETNVAGGFQIVQRLGVGVIFPVKELDGPLVLQAAIDSHLLFHPLRFKRQARHFHVHGDRDGSRHHEYQQQRKTGLTLPLVVPPAFHPFNSATSGNVCWLLSLNSVSSTTAEFTPIRTIL